MWRSAIFLFDFSKKKLKWASINTLIKMTMLAHRSKYYTVFDNDLKSTEGFIMQIGIIWFRLWWIQWIIVQHFRMKFFLTICKCIHSDEGNTIETDAPKFLLFSIQRNPCIVRLLSIHFRFVEYTKSYISKTNVFIAKFTEWNSNARLPLLKSHKINRLLSKRFFFLQTLWFEKCTQVNYAYCICEENIRLIYLASIWIKIFGFHFRIPSILHCVCVCHRMYQIRLTAHRTKADETKTRQKIASTSTSTSE